jgi:peptidoglycan/LPS O-acetylase OafA/YrhL
MVRHPPPARGDVTASPSAPGTAISLTRLPALDGLRAVAILAVILFHYKNDWVPGGFIGVDLFFVLSGYVITRSLRQEIDTSGSISLRSFYMRRAFRILPALLVAVAGVIVLSAAAGQLSSRDLHAGLAVVTSTYNWFLAHELLYGTDFVHLWSLSVEEQFYLLWPAAFLLLSKKRPSAVRPFLCAAICASVCLSIYVSFEGTWQRAYFASDTRAQAILIGCLLALGGTAAVPKRLLRAWPVPTLVFVAMALTMDNHNSQMGLWGFTVAAIASAWLVTVAVEGSERLPQQVLTSPVLQWLGRRSYSLFLWHFPIAQALALAGIRFWPWLALLASLIVAELSYRLVEEPFIRKAARRRDAHVSMEAQAAP